MYEYLITTKLGTIRYSTTTSNIVEALYEIVAVLLWNSPAAIAANSPDLVKFEMTNDPACKIERL